MSDYDDPRPSSSTAYSDPCAVKDMATTLGKLMDESGYVTTYTGKSLPTITELATRYGWVIKGLFADGFTFETASDLGQDANGDLWRYTGTLPFTVTAGTVPTSPTYREVFLRDHNSLDNRNAVGAHDAIYRRATTVAEIATGVFSVGDRLEVTDRANAPFDVVSGGTANNADTLHAGVGKTAQYQYTSSIDAEAFGIFGNNSGSPYSSSFLRFFEVSGFDYVTTATLPNAKIYFDNSTPASFQSNCTYIGGKNTFIQPTVFTQRVFLTQNKSNFYIVRLRSYIDESLDGENNNVGGGYWRFEGCSYFELDDVEVSRSFAGAFKFLDCVEFKITRIRANFNQFTGVELEGCSAYTMTDYDLSYNGRYSSDQSYKPLPAGWTGTHGGRGWVVAANGANVDQNGARISHGRCWLNSEYGVRAFAANTPSPTNFSFDNLNVKDSGAPSGTYGTITLASNKGADVLINTDTTFGDSSGISWSDITISRSFGFGSPISVSGIDHSQRDVLITLTGSATHASAAMGVLDTKGFKSTNLTSKGASIVWAFGGGTITDIEIIGDRATNNLKYIQGTPTGGTNRIRDCISTHRAAVAVSGENGFEPSANWDVKGLQLSGYWQSFTNSSTNATYDDVRTKNSVTLGLRDFSSGVAGVNFKNCDFDSANPESRASAMGEGAGNRNIGISFAATIPTAGYFKAGYIVFDMTPTVGTLGWRRLTTGTGHVVGVDWEVITN